MALGLLDLVPSDCVDLSQNPVFKAPGDDVFGEEAEWWRNLYHEPLPDAARLPLDTLWPCGRFMQLFTACGKTVRRRGEVG